MRQMKPTKLQLANLVVTESSLVAGERYHCRVGSHGFNFLASHIWMVRSVLPLAIRVPSGLNATLKIGAECPFRLSVSSPVAESQTLRVWSTLPLTIRLPSGLKATLKIRSVCPFRVNLASPLAASQTLRVWL